MAGSNYREQWQTALEARGFRGNVANAALLMAAFEDGKAWMEEKFRRRGLLFVSPPIVLVDDLGRAQYQHQLSNRTLEVSLRKLEADSLDDPWEVFDFFNPAKELTFVGNLQEFKAIGGLEEAGHCVRSQFRFTPRNPDGNNHLGTTADYHSIPMEFDALNWKCQYAKEKGLLVAYQLFDETRRNARDRYLVNKKAERRLLGLHRKVRRESLRARRGESEPDVEVA